MGFFRPLSRGAVAAVTGIAVLGVGGVVVAATRLATSSGSDAAPGALPDNATPVVRVVGLHKGHVSWDRPLRLRATAGSLQSVVVSTRDGVPLEGSLSSDATRWSSEHRLVPLARYRARVVLGGGDEAVTKTLRLRATDADRHLTALLSPGDGDVVGVGSPVVVRLSRPVLEKQRAMVQSRLAVSTTPSVVGAWHWMNAQELHWRPPTYWKAHSSVTVSSHLDGLYLGHGVWGAGDHRTHFRIGDSHISRVDAARHQMYVYNNGTLIHTYPISAGNDKYPTKSGVHITFEKSQVVTMDSATVGIPRDSPDGYYEKVYWDVRISYGGAFVHAAPWSVASQGVVNVSHGCVNMAPASAEWFYNWSQRGDIVDVYNTLAPPDTADPGMADWNMSWKEWVAGDADPTGDALHTHAPMPRAAEPPAPSATTSTTSSGGQSSPSHDDNNDNHRGADASPTPHRTRH
jgi:lipoprotein-anchoring transpeptidase ErfK/SrfK